MFPCLTLALVHEHGSEEIVFGETRFHCPQKIVSTTIYKPLVVLSKKPNQQQLRLSPSCVFSTLFLCSSERHSHFHRLKAFRNVPPALSLHGSHLRTPTLSRAFSPTSVRAALRPLVQVQVLWLPLLQRLTPTVSEPVVISNRDSD